jgi:spoIIIJ-associated protein
MTMGQDRIAIEGQSINDALDNACEALGVESDHEFEFEYDREHFRSGASTVRIFAWKRDPKILEAVGFAHEFVVGFLQRFGVDDANVRVIEEDEKVTLSVNAPGQEGNLLIGREGQNLDALQHVLTAAMTHRGIQLKAVIDVEEYRSRREDRIRDQAQSAIRNVLNYGDSVVIGPMNSYERRLIHVEVKKHDGLRSRSVGDGKMKDVEIARA